MPRRAKDEEKTEMMIRGLLKQEDNRRCINCNSLGPQYVCTTFWTFVCTNCSGVHREFSHRVKSVSMAKFNEEEITALQAGGNERAKEIYFKTWDSQRNTYPESSNLQRLREFVNHVYVDRRYSGDKNANKLSMVKSDSKSNSYELSFDRRSRGSKDDFSYERTDRNGRDDNSLSDNNKVLNLKDFLEERSPRRSQEKPRGRTTRFEIVDDRYREDGTVKKYERYVTREAKSASSSPGHPSGRTMSLPAIRPLKSIVGEEVPALRIEGPPGRKDTKGSAGVETLQKSATLPVANEKQYNAATSSSLIDFFDAEPEPSSSPAQPQPSSKASTAINERSSSSNQTAPNVPELLLDWSSPVASPSSATKAPETSNSFGTHANDQPLHSETRNPIAQEIQMHQLPTSHMPPSSSSLYWNKSQPPNDLRRVQSAPLEQPSHAVNPEASAPSARKEIPQDLFASPFNPTGAGWPMHQPQGAAYGMHFHHPMMSAAAFQNHPRPRNPFDIGDDRFQVQAASFSSMSSMQGALPNMPASALPSQSHMSPYGMNMPQAYMGQLPNNMPLTRPEGNANFGRTEDAFASLNPIQQTSGSHSSPAASTSPLPRAGNPFG